MLFLTHSFPRHVGDAPGSFLLQLATALRDEGIDVAVLAPSAPGLPAQERLDGIPVHRFRYAPSPFETLAYTGNMVAQVRTSWTGKLALLGLLGAELRAANRLSRTWRPTIVHAHWWFPSGLVASRMRVSSGTRLVTTLHGTDLRMARSGTRAARMFRSVVRRSARVTTVSHWLSRQAEVLAPGLSFAVAPMPVASALFTAKATTPAEFRLLFVGRLNAQKGIVDTIRALAELPPSVSLDVVGTGPDEAIARNLASRLGIASRIRWHDIVHQAALAPLYQGAMALIMPSVDEGLGLVAVESLLCETPVVAYDSGGLPDVVQHGRTGLLVPPGDASGLARAVADLASREDRGRSLGRAGRAQMLATFAPAAAARRYADLYRTVRADLAP